MLSAFIVSICMNQPPSTTIDFKDAVFTIQTSGGVEKVKLAADSGTTPGKFDFTDQGTRVYFDGNKLTVRKGKYARSTQFPDIPTSPRLFSKEQIQETVQTIESGAMSRAASAITGYELLGNSLVLMLRWNAHGKPAFEALVSFDLSAAQPWFKVLYKMPGISLTPVATKVSDELFVEGGRLGSIGRQGERWGLSTWDLQEQFIRFFPMGNGLARYSIPDKDIKRVLFVERTEYGTWLAGSVELNTLDRTDVAESRDKVSFVSAEPAILRIDSTQSCRIRYADSGLEQQFAPWTAARLTKAGLLTWRAAQAPTNAVLYAKDSWKPVAEWAAAAKPGS